VLLKLRERLATAVAGAVMLVAHRVTGALFLTLSLAFIRFNGVRQLE